MNTNGMNERAVSYGMELRLDLAQHGVETSLPAGVETFIIRNVTYTRAELAKKIAEMNSRWKQAREAHAILRQFTYDKPRLNREANEFLGDLKSHIGSLVGRDNEVLTRFGFPAVKRRRTLTVEEKVLRAAKARLTREMRGTKGSRQRAELRATGTPDVVITPDGTMHVKNPESTPPPPASPSAPPPAPPAP